RPEFARDHYRLARLAHEMTHERRAQIPPLNENAFRTQFWRVLRTARVFLDAEEEHCRQSQPRFFEVAIGMPSVADGTPLDEGEALAVRLPGGERILARGQVDRVDELAPHRFAL